MFVEQGGTIRLAGTTSVNGAGGVAGGTGNAPGSALGGAIFLQGTGAAGALTFAPGAGQIQTIANSIADQTGSGGTGTNNYATGGTKTGNGGSYSGAGSYGLTVDGSTTGTLALSSANTYTGLTTVTSGTLNIQNNFSLGTSDAGTVVQAGTFQLQNATGGTGITITGEALSLAGFGTTNGNGALQNVSGVNTYTGAITLTAASRINSDAGSLILSGGINGSGGSRALNLGGASTGANTISGSIGGNVSAVNKDGASTWTFTGANTYFGGTIISAGTLQIGSGGATGSIIGPVVDNAALIFDRSDAVDFIDPIIGTGTLQKLGAGVLTLSAANNYIGATTVTAGTLLVNGSIANSATTVQAGGTLGGSGTTGAVTVQSGGTLSAGNSPGILNTSNLILSAGSTLRQEIGGAIARTGYDQINVTGSVALNGAALDVQQLGAYQPGSADRFVIINNDGTDAITGTFAGLAEGASVTIGTAAYTITYQGDAAAAGVRGNDIVLERYVPPQPDPGLTGPTAGDDNLVGTGGPDTIVLGQGADTFAGGTGNDLVYGNQGNDLIYGNQDADTLYGGQGDDRAFGGQDDDRLYGNLGNDVLFGNLGNDIVYGNQGEDIVYGNQGADILFGGQGNDVLYGGQDADTLVGGIGDDTLVGGLGADLYVFGSNSGRDLILGFNQTDGDRIALGGQTYTVSSAQNGDALLTLSGGDTVDLVGIRADQVNASYFAA